MARSRNVAYKKNKGKRIANLLIILVVCALFLVVSVSSINLCNKLKDLHAKEQDIQRQIEEEEARRLEIEEYEKYTHTMGYVEDVAKDRLGLVYEGEIVFKEEN